MKRIFACLLAAALLLACAGCGAKKSGESGEEKTLTGTLDEVKDFMFVVTDDNGDSDALTFEEALVFTLEPSAAGAGSSVYSLRGESAHRSSSL